MKIKYYKSQAPRQDDDFYVSGCGVREKMPPCIVNRPGGTRDRLLMFFYTPVKIMLQGEVKSFSGNTLMLWEDMAGHYYGSPEEKWNHTWIHFHGSETPKLLEESGIVSGTTSVFNQPEIMEFYLFKIYQELTRQLKPDMVIMKNLFECMMLEIARSRNLSDRMQIPERILTAKSIVESDPFRKISLQKLAESACLSIPRFCAEFKQYIGTSPIEYQLRLRMEYARYLLLNHNLTISEIAGQTGYGDIFQFSKAFKKRFGQCPSAFARHSAS